MGYFLCAQASIYLYVPGGPFIPIWLPSGLYVAVLLLNKRRDWPGLVLAVLPANLLFDLLHGTKLVIILVFYCANTSEAVIGAWLIRRFVAERPTLATLKEFMGLLGFSVVLSTILGATISAGMLTALGSTASFAQAWKDWWTGEAMAILLFSSFILTWFPRPGENRLYFLAQRKKLLEAWLLVMVSITLTWHLLHVGQGIMTVNTSEMLLPLLWAGLRFGPRGATAANLLLALPMAFFTSQFSAGLTPQQVSSGEYLFHLQFSLAVASLVGLIPAIVLYSHQHAEEQIAEQAALLDQARDAIVVRDLNGAILFWSKGAERIYGWTREEALGHDIRRLIYPDPKKLEAVNRQFLDQGEWYGELQHLTKDRRVLTIEARWTLVRDKEGQPKSILSINTDVTEKKKIEAQFMRAQRMESLGTLAGGIAHDLNNILAPIMMSIDILKLKVTDPQAKSILKTIEVSSKRGADIVRQVLLFARGLEGERIEVQPNDLLRDIEAIIKDTFPKNIRLELSLPENSWKILGDPTQLHQILLNLCLNARDAMPHGGSLTFSLENAVLDERCAAIHLQARAGRYVMINVVDSGTGIPSAILDKIFEPFFTTKEVGKGTGIGLSTVLAIVKSHGGFVNVHSEPGKGTTFKIYIPAMEAASEARKDAADLPGLPPGKGETVLIVDDEASVLTVTSQTLEAFGYRTLVAANGEEAVAVYAQHRDNISVVLTDMAMPIMDGLATIRALNKINPAIKIIVASGSASSGSVTKISDHRIKHFLAKPYSTETLLKMLQAALEET